MTKKLNPAIVVDTKLEDFLALAKKLSIEVDHQAISNRVVFIRQTRNGAMFIEVDSGATSIKVGMVYCKARICVK